ncbi:FGGY-family carbohydrate kinase [Labrenzia sp. OB1]|uniref:FGGY-family carbohydrate kinase n=1 Tax=Labrenzia sp. OB1 TaxID=1561204 RepID=UPI0007B18867|nr:FGGY-family carbohydrate kinase [Labrenzia sp. OB1]KZM48552.1 carbohydrate kinase [Labrenzia sp. OB1]
MTRTDLFVGIDIGTSGVRAVALDPDLQVNAIARADFGTEDVTRRDPSVWDKALGACLADLCRKVDPADFAALSVDGTSGTILALDADNAPVGAALMYNDTVEDQRVLAEVAASAPRESAAHGASSALARAITLQQRSGVVRIVHQADWIAERLAGHPVPGDESNALKTGYDPVARQWPEWIKATSLRMNLLPEVVPTGTLTGKTGGAYGLPSGISIVAGMTDGCASFLATGASRPGDGVTALGTTMTLKLLSDGPLFAPEYGIYSHRIGDLWLAGGASNSGGGALLAHFTPAELADLSAQIDPESACELDYYPLTSCGERFPINDPALPPRETPRPEDDAEFLKGLLTGIARIEALGYQRLSELGAPSLVSVRTVGGGSNNAVWSRIRLRLLGVSAAPVLAGEAAAGSAVIARGAMV